MSEQPDASLPPEQPEPPSPAVPVFKISLTNAALLSTLYLAVASLVEIIRRVWNPRWVDRVSFSLEAFPARTLELFGLFQPLHEAYLKDEISPLGVRFVYGFVTIAIIFTLGGFVGGMMALIARVAQRSGSHQEE
ncbi:MAG: hypothetical protein QM817_19540 [Archangium sp.]